MLDVGCWMLDVGCWFPHSKVAPQRPRHLNSGRASTALSRPRSPLKAHPFFQMAKKTTPQTPRHPLRAPTSKIKHPTSRPNSSRPPPQRTPPSARSPQLACDGGLGSGEGDVGCWMLDVGCWMLDVGSRLRRSFPKGLVISTAVGRRRPCRAQDPH